MNKKIKKLELLVKQTLSKRTGAHGWDHVQRVRMLAREIAKRESGDLDIIDAMALLHDISREDTFDGNKSLINTIKMAKEFLIKCGFNEVEKGIIINGIKSHSLHANKSTIPKSIEAQILFDADKIDATGEIGLARLFSVAAKDNISINKSAQLYLESVKKFDDEFNGKLYTKTSTQIVVPRILFSKTFLEKLINSNSNKLYNLKTTKPTKSC
ncbi:MAG: HD domain-containing protein [Sphaerochaetaceae bacterium]|nr:HD domain-containing protein [Sphaerochaetaceae bacterium]